MDLKDYYIGKTLYKPDKFIKTEISSYIIESLHLDSKKENIIMMLRNGDGFGLIEVSLNFKTGIYIKVYDREPIELCNNLEEANKKLVVLIKKEIDRLSKSISDIEKRKKELLNKLEELK